MINKNIFTKDLKDIKTNESKLMCNNTLYVKVSYDLFDRFIDEFKDINVLELPPFNIEVYDERDNADYESIRKFLSIINNYPISNIKFCLSDITYPIYNFILKYIAWSHEQQTVLKLSYDYNPLSLKSRIDMNIPNSLGKIDIKENKLLMFTNSDLTRSKRKLIVPSNEVIALKNFSKDLFSKLDNEYDLSRSTSYEKTMLVYNYVRNSIYYPSELYYKDSNGNKYLSSISPSFINSAYGTLTGKIGNEEGISKLMASILYNKNFMVDADTFNEWVIVNIDGYIFELNLKDRPFSYSSNLDIYGKTKAHLTNDDIDKINRNILRLKRK